MQFIVWFSDGSAEVHFTSYEEAEHYASLNAGNVLDVDKWETIARFS